MTRRCGHCGEEIHYLARAGAKWCSGRCRVAAHRAGRNIPAELRERDRWVRRSRNKVPLTVVGAAASSTNPATWSPYVVAASSPVGAGLGYVLTDADGIVCLDLDHCLRAGQLAPWARTILGQLPDTYVEVSVSGTGLHVFGYGRLERGRRLRVGDRHVEAYSSGRYIAVTGSRFESSPLRLADLSEALASIL